MALRISPRSWSLVDLGAGAAVLLAVAGAVWSPKLSSSVAQATGAMQSVTVTVDVRGVPSTDSAQLIADAQKEGKVAIVIRNQPHGSVAIERIVPLSRRISAVQPDGKVVSAPDPNQEVFGTLDARFVLRGQGRKASGGVVFGNQTIKIGAPVELEGTQYRFGGTVSNLQIGT